MAKNKKKVGDKILGFADNVGPHGARTGQLVMPVCSACGRKINMNSKICPYCGNNKV